MAIQTTLLPRLEAALLAICTQLHRHEVQHWLDAPGTLETRSNNALAIAREGLHELRDAAATVALFHAAPDMLAALQQCVIDFETVDSSCPEEPGIAAARAAIRKATTR